MKFFITGASGYIGSRLVSRMRALGHVVVAGSRQPISNGVEWQHYDFLSGQPTVPVSTDVVLHLAASASLDAASEAVELNAAIRLIAAADLAGARFIFVSSQTANADAPTVYGRTKWQIEQAVLAKGGSALRPGQVYGGVEQGLFKILVQLTRRLPVLPRFLPEPLVLPIHVDDLVEALLAQSMRGDARARVLCIGSLEPVPFSVFLSAISQARAGRTPFFLPIPRVLVQAASLLVGSRLRRSTGLERLTSLFRLPPMDTAADMACLGIACRPLSQGMSRSGSDRRTRLLRESQALLTYVLKIRPPGALLRRHVRTIEALRSGLAIGLPDFAMRLPVTIALFDNPRRQGSSALAEFSWRLDSAVVLAEACTTGANRFLAIDKSQSGFLRSLMRIGFAVGEEIFWRVMCVFKRPEFKPLAHKSAGK